MLGVAAAEQPLIVGLGGTVRSQSSTEQALRYALGAVERLGARTLMLSSADLDLPMYEPESEVRTPKARHLMDALNDADGLIIASPGYHGGTSGLIKNALDYVEDLRDAKRAYLEGRAVGCIVCANGWQATGTTLVALRSIIHALRGWPTPIGVAINTAEQAFIEGRPPAGAAAQIEVMAEQLVSFAQGYGQRAGSTSTASA
jgi:FMN reductase